jgi:exonuclease SbcC
VKKKPAGTIRIAHTGDLHVTRGPRFELARTCLDFIVADGTNRGADLWLVGGDLTGTTVPHKSEPEERLLIAHTLQAMAESAPVIVAEGNHEFPGDILIYEKLRGRFPIYVETRPEARILDLATGPVLVLTLPYPTKRWGQVTEKGGIEAALRDLLDYWRGVVAEERAKGVPTILLAHIAIGGCLVGGGEVLIGREVELAPHDLDELGVDVVLLSHIHKQQKIAKAAWYAGSPLAQNFGEPDRKGYLIADVASGVAPVVTVVPTPARRMLTIDVAWVPGAAGFRGPTGGPLVLSDVRDAELRLRVTVDEEHASTCPLDELEAMATAAGVNRVVVERHIRPRVRSRLEALPAPGGDTGDTLADAWQAATSLGEKVSLWATTLGREAPPAALIARAVTRLAELTAGTVGGGGRTAPQRARDISLVRVRLRHVSAAFQASEAALDVAQLGPGLICLVGENGAGKSVLMEASGPAALYGTWPTYGLTAVKDMVIPGERAAEIEAVYLVDGVEIVSRWRIDSQYGGGRGKAEAWLGVRNPDGSLAPLPGAVAPSGPGVGEHQQAVAEWFPSEPLFLAAWFAAQGRRGAAANFFGLAKKDRKDLFLAMLGLGHLQELAEEAGDRAECILVPLDAARRDLAAAEAALVQATVLDTQLATCERAAAGLDEAAAALRAERTAAEDRHLFARTALARAEAQDEAVVAEIERVTQQRVELGAEVAQLRRRIAELDDSLVERPTLEAEAATRADHEEAVAALRAQLDELLAPDAPLAEARAQVTSLTAERERALTEWTRLSADLTAAQAAYARVLRAIPGGWGAFTTTIELHQDEVHQLRAVVDRLQADTEALEAAAEAEARADVTHAQEVRDQAAHAQRAELLDQIPGVPECDACPLTADARRARGRAANLATILASSPVPTSAARLRLTEHRTTLATQRQALRTREQRLEALERTRQTVQADMPVAGRVDELTAAKEANVAAGKAIAAQLATAQETVTAEGAKVEVTRGALAEQETLLRAATVATTALAELATVAARRTDAAQRLAVLAASLETPPVLPARPDLNEPRQTVTSAEHMLRHATTWVAECTTWQRAVDAERGRAQGQREALGDPAAAQAAAEAEVAQLDAGHAEWALLARALGRDGIQACEIDAAGPAVSTLANDLLLTCYGPRFTLALDTQAAKVDGGVKEVFDVRILDAQTGREAREGSGGEQTILNEALALGIAIWNAQRSGWHVRTLWRDETTAALTAAHAARYVTMLRRAAEVGGFTQVLLVSHQESVWQSADVRVRVEGGAVTVESELPATETPAADAAA